MEFSGIGHGYGSLVLAMVEGTTGNRVTPDVVRSQLGQPAVQKVRYVPND
jgi:hypothetical protein